MRAPKQKWSLYFNQTEAERFEVVLNAAKSRSCGRALPAEVMKELMGFPLADGKDPVLTDAERQIISAPVACRQPEEQRRRSPNPPRGAL